MIPDWQKNVCQYNDWLGRLLRGRGRRAEAEKAFRKSLDTFKIEVANFPGWENMEFPLEAAIGLIGLHIEAQRFSDSNRVFLEVLRLLEELVVSLHREERFQLVINLCTEFENLQKRYPQTPELIPPYRDAIAFFQELVASHPAEAKYRQTLGRLYGLAGESEKSRSELEKCLQLEPTNFEIWFHVGVASLNRQDWETAIGQFSKSIELNQDPDKVSLLGAAWHHRSTAHANKGDSDEAFRGLTRAIELVPGSYWHWYERAQLHERQKHWKEAIADCSKAIELQPQAAWLWSMRGANYLELHEWDKAIADFSRVIEQNRQESEAWYLRGVARANLNQPESAIADIRQAIERGLDNRDRIKRDTRLSALRAHKDFEALVQGSSTR
jgi:tetratricopeptide (TPR) repeat protein